MKDAFIAVMDSGIGGISVLKQLVGLLPNENFLYYGDNLNAPYGNKHKRQLLDLTTRNLNYILRYPIKAIVLACNTLSVNVIEDVMKYVNVPVFGVFPPIETSIMSGGKTLLLSTVGTASRFKSNKWCDVAGFTTLASQIEKNAFSLDKIDLNFCIENQKVGKVVNQKGYYNTVILGCTHYELIEKQISDHFCPKKIINGSIFAIKNILDWSKHQKSSVNYYRKGVLFVGESAKFNEDFFNFGGQSGSN